MMMICKLHDGEDDLFWKENNIGIHQMFLSEPNIMTKNTIFQVHIRFSPG